MNKELIFPGLIIGVTLGAAAFTVAGGDERKTAEPFNPSLAGGNFVETVDRMPTLQELDERVVEPNLLDKVINLLGTLPSGKMKQAADELRLLKERGILSEDYYPGVTIGAIASDLTKRSVLIGFPGQGSGDRASELSLAK